MEIDAVNAAAQVTKLLQIASGASYTGMAQALQDQYALLDTARYELIADLVGERKHSVVFFNWRHQRDEVMKELTNRNITFTTFDGTVGNIERARRVRDFQAGFYRVMLAQPQSAAHGLTHTKATTTIWASPTYNPSSTSSKATGASTARVRPSAPRRSTSSPRRRSRSRSR